MEYLGRQPEEAEQGTPDATAMQPSALQVCLYWEREPAVAWLGTPASVHNPIVPQVQVEAGSQCA